MYLLQFEKMSKQNQNKSKC